MIVDGIGVGPEIDCAPTCDLMEATARQALARRSPGASATSVTWHVETQVGPDGSPILTNRSGIFAIALFRMDDGTETAFSIACGNGASCWHVAAP